MSLLFHMLSRLVIAFLPSCKHLLISGCSHHLQWFWSPQEIKSLTVSPSICHEVMGPEAMILVFWMLSFKSTFSLSSFTFIKRLFCSSSLSAIRVGSSVYLRLLAFFPGNLNSSLCFIQPGISHEVHTSLVAQTVKASAYNARDLGLIPGLGRSPGEGNGNPLQYSCLEKPMDGGAW